MVLHVSANPSSDNHKTARVQAWSRAGQQPSEATLHGAVNRVREGRPIAQMSEAAL